MTKNTKAAAERWLNANIGRTITTVQVNATTGRVWNPGPRTLARTGCHTWMLDGSEVRVTYQTPVLISDQVLALELCYEDGSLIHTTTYTVSA